MPYASTIATRARVRKRRLFSIVAICAHCWLCASGDFASARALLVVAQISQIERTAMRTEDLFSGAVPMVVKLDIGMTEPEGIVLEITYAQTRERFEARQFD